MFADCCGRYVRGSEAAPTAEALMRSRYSAYVAGDTAYLLRTWASEQRPSRLDLMKDHSEWLGLQIVRTVGGGEAETTGEVEFIARFRLTGRQGQLHERSRFRRDAGAWVYVDGDVQTSYAAPPPAAPARVQPSVGRNDPCPCGSGQKWKRCCGR